MKGFCCHRCGLSRDFWNHSTWIEIFLVIFIWICSIHGDVEQREAVLDPHWTTCARWSWSSLWKKLYCSKYFRMHFIPGGSIPLPYRLLHKVNFKLWYQRCIRKPNLPNIRSRRNSIDSFRLEVSGNLTQVAELQRFWLSVALVDQRGKVVTAESDLELQIGSEVALLGSTTVQLKEGRARFQDIMFANLHPSCHLRIRTKSQFSSSVEVLPWISSAIVVTARLLYLRPSGASLPHDSRENYKMSPAAGIVIYDSIDGVPADREYLSRYRWEGWIEMLYKNVYPGRLSGTTSKTLDEGNNELIFGDLTLTAWGYDYILRINLRALDTDQIPELSCLIGPFNVDVVHPFGLPLVESSEFRRVQIAFDGDYSEVQKDKQKFIIFFLNTFGRKYPKVRWQNVSVTEGSVRVKAVLTGLTEHLEETSEALADDILKGKADMKYVEDKVWKVSVINVPSRKLLQENTQAAKAEESNEELGTLSVAWIAAITINVLLVIIFITVVVYCYCRNKNKGERTDKPDIAYVEKATAQLKGADKPPQPWGSRPQGPSPERERCECSSPRCYCSVGDKEEDPEEEDTWAPTPLPPEEEMEEEVDTVQQRSPTPETEDFWRPDSAERREEEEEELEELEEDSYMPGVVTPEAPPAEKRYLVYRIEDEAGSREYVGQLDLPRTGTLAELRIRLGAMATLSEGGQFTLLDEALRPIPIYQESSLDMERTYPSQGVNFKFLPKPKVPKRPKLPVYVGPMGICSALDCTNAARIKCLDCSSTAYCSTRCMKKDIPAHRKACFKPAWRL